MNDVRKVVSGFVEGLSNADFEVLESAVRAEREQRREKLDLADIRPGMSAEERDKVRAEIARLIRE